jgi:hypothetical protein
MNERRRMVLVTVDGRRLLWHKGGRIHDLAPELAPVWVASFKPALFQVLPDGHIVPRGSDPKAVDIQSVAIANDEPVSDHPEPG